MSILVINDVSPNNVQINNNLTTVTISNEQGPQGAASVGATGPAGPQGPPGPVNVGTSLNTQVLYNSSGTIDGSDGLIYDRVNNRVGIGSTAPQSKLDIQTNNLSADPAESSGIWMENTTLALNGSQQATPSIIMEGQGFATTPVTSMSVKWKEYALPIQGTSVPSVTYVWAASINGGAYNNIMTLNSSSGVLSAGSFVSSGSSSNIAFQSSLTLVNSNFASAASSNATTTAASLLFSGATSVGYRIFSRGSGVTALTTAQSYGSFIIGSQGPTTFTSGTHALLAQQVINPLAVTAGGATVTNTASIYVNGVSTATVTGVNYGIWSTGVNRLGSLILDTALPIAQGGTGQTTAANAFTALSPTQLNKAVLTSNGTTSAFSLTDMNTNNLLFVQDQKPAATDGGAITAGTWQTKTLNTSIVSNIAGGGLSANQIQLPAGTYYVQGRSPVVDCDRNKARLQNVTDGTTAIVGSSSFCTTGTQADSLINGYFTIAATKTFELQHYAQTANGNTFGRGFSSSSGLIDIYSEVQVWKVG